jgi:hypothetical protein
VFLWSDVICKQFRVLLSNFIHIFNEDPDRQSKLPSQMSPYFGWYCSLFLEYRGTKEDVAQDISRFDFIEDTGVIVPFMENVR